MAIKRTGIKDGIEFFAVLVDGGQAPVHMVDGGQAMTDCQCARCGSSCFFHACSNCGGEGVIEDDWQGFDHDHDERCDWCRGIGGWYRCLSKDYCEKNPLPGREDQPVMAVEAPIPPPPTTEPT